MSDLSDLMNTSPSEMTREKLQDLIAAIRAQRVNFDSKGAPAKSAVRETKASATAKAAASLDLDFDL